ncbi:hypothetical protein BCR44DRAFT_194817 [Catenaria anguillulae PL171]|uniref:Uncharacterized protein n=1 Tax=Catenaria anguillulae PL171 TaxID=765915 RepID=A0A1Y2HIF0_9FUNG|nr:hypothetical protein BCR44DRAFT_194817 [Catenaria anguillulae PL171]
MPVCRRCHLLYTRDSAPSPAPNPSTSSSTQPSHASAPTSQDQHTAIAMAAKDTAASTTSTPKCRYHPDMFVCRPHAADHYAFEINDQFMKDLKGWPAKFWDCCGAETADAPGCVVAEEHVPAYD